MAKYYPINLVLKNKQCVVIGAGTVAERKVKRLLEYGARICVISPEITPGLKFLAQKKKIILKCRKVSLNDLKGAYLVIAATTDRKTNALVSKYCQKKNILINVVDFPKDCNFILPSVVRRGALTISISTDGVSPALARKIREDLEKNFGAEYTKLLRLLKGIRPLAIKKIKSMSARKAFFQKAFQPKLISLLKQNKEKQARQMLERILDHAN